MFLRGLALGDLRVVRSRSSFWPVAVLVDQNQADFESGRPLVQVPSLTTMQCIVEFEHVHIVVGR